MINRIDKATNFVRLRWDREEENSSELSALKSFGLTPVNSIRRRVHLFTTDGVVELIGAHVLHKRTIDSLFDGNERWSQKTFYVIRFN